MSLCSPGEGDNIDDPGEDITVVGAGAGTSGEAEVVGVFP